MLITELPAEERNTVEKHLRFARSLQMEEDFGLIPAPRLSAPPQRNAPVCQPNPLKVMHLQPENMRPGPGFRRGIFLRNAEVLARYISFEQYFLAALLRRGCRHVSCGT